MRPDIAVGPLQHDERRSLTLCARDRLANVVAWLIAVINNFVLNRHWTFDARGGPDAPLTESEIIAKYRQYATPALGPEKAAALENAVLGLCDEDGDFSSVVALT